MRFFSPPEKSFVDSSLEKFRIQIQVGGYGPYRLHEFHGVRLRISSRSVEIVEGRFQELHVADAGNFHRILKSEEKALLGSAVPVPHH